MGTASISTGQFGEFVGAVVSQLWPIVKDMSPTQIQHLIENQGDLKNLIQRAFSENEKFARLYVVTVNYGMDVKQAIEFGNYDWVGGDISQKNFPTKRKGNVDIILKLIHFNRDISTDQVLEELDQMGYRPAELIELLAFGEKYPQVQREFPIIALDSVWQAIGGAHYAPGLSGPGSERALGLGCVQRDWDKTWRFAAVPK